MGKLAVIIPAAGKGTRMGTEESKQFLHIADKPILVHTLQLFEDISEVDLIVLVVQEHEVKRCRSWINQYALTKVQYILSGGMERQDSVEKGLDILSEDVEWVMVHDAVRPFVTKQNVKACLTEANQSGAAVLAVPVKDTIKVVNESGQIQHTPERKSLWAIQTPQAFRASLLKQAYHVARKQGYSGTDDSMLVERMGETVQVVQGAYTNIKITTPEDLDWARWKLQQDERGEHGI